MERIKNGVAQASTTDEQLLANIDYACGHVGDGCSVIQQGRDCYESNTFINHASRGEARILALRPKQK
ncbi:hypothetical protein Dsin_019838 [Dipteronia sinensis]|uniref:X8 domain-containing protein n=1 Tax=Dipteronia sinensis TaxID=43782 RepID=A0AAE0A8I0_9ROSI|nr:hypothetical protein Dsin_019838 [Dipteronia sinensis]